MVYKERYFNKFVDEIMEDGIERSSSAIIELLKDTMGKKNEWGLNRSGHCVPLIRTLIYYLRINKNYTYIDKDTMKARWKKVNKYDNK